AEEGGRVNGFRPPRALVAARARQYRLRGQNPSAQSCAHPGQAGRAVPTLLTVLTRFLDRGWAPASVSYLQIVFARRSIARLGWHRARRRGHVAFWRNSASPRAVIAQRPGGCDLEAVAEAA